MSKFIRRYVLKADGRHLNREQDVNIAFTNCLRIHDVAKTHGVADDTVNQDRFLNIKKVFYYLFIFC